MNEIMYQKSYEEYKAELDGELQRSAESFVRIGYLLKVARDTNILEESGYKSVAEFAEAEYNLNKTQVSRFISINDKFSEGGYSDHLLPDYKGFGYAKLTIMLQIPDAINEELSPNFSKAEIQAIKEEIDNEKTVTDLERIMEGSDTLESVDERIEALYKTILQLGEDEPGLYVELSNRRNEDMSVVMPEIMAPDGEKIYSVRVRGIGRLMLTISDMSDSVKLINSRTGEKESFTWADVAGAWEYAGILGLENQTGVQCWEKRYERRFPVEEVAPVQLQNGTKSDKNEKKDTQSKKPEQKKQSKVVKAQDKKHDPAAAVPEEEVQLPGQMSVEDYDGVVPEATYEEVNEDGQTEDDGMSERSGATGDALEPGIDAGASGETEDADTTGHYDESVGTAESGGCEADSEQIEEIWMEIYKNHGEISKYLSVWESQHSLMERDMVRKLYDMSIAMAAGFERLMQRGQDHE